jgi:rubrerythrin
LRAELAATRGLLEELLNAHDSVVQRLKDRMSDADRGHLDWFLREIVQLGDKQPNRRRYSERMLEVAFTLHRQSPVAYETLRDLIALPSHTSLQTKFREVMGQQVR